MGSIWSLLTGGSVARRCFRWNLEALWSWELATDAQKTATCHVKRSWCPDNTSTALWRRNLRSGRCMNLNATRAHEDLVHANESPRHQLGGCYFLSLNTFEDVLACNSAASAHCLIRFLFTWTWIAALRMMPCCRSSDSTRAVFRYGQTWPCFTQSL